MSLSALRAVIITGLLFILALVGLSHSQWIFHVLFPRLERPVYRRVSFFELTASHTGLVLIATGLAAVIAIALAVLVTRPFGKRLKPLVLAVAVVGQTFPPVAVLAVTIPLLGYGAGPTEVALFAYALLPIFLNTVAGLEESIRTLSKPATAWACHPSSAWSDSTYRWPRRPCSLESGRRR